MRAGVTRERHVDHAETERVLGPGIRATREEIAEVRDGRSIVRLPRADVARLALGRGPVAERSVLEGAVGLGPLVAGVWLMWRALAAMGAAEATRTMLYVAGSGAFMLVLAATLLLRVVRVGDVVVVALRAGGQRKLAFSLALVGDQRERFAAKLRELGWSVTTSA